MALGLKRTRKTGGGTDTRSFFGKIKEMQISSVICKHVCEFGLNVYSQLESISCYHIIYINFGGEKGKCVHFAFALHSVDFLKLRKNF